MSSAVRVAAILAAVAGATQLAVGDIVGTSRIARLVRARFAIAWLARRHTDKTYRQIGVVLGNRDPSTIVNQVDRAGRLRDTDVTFRALTDRLDNLLEGM